MKTIALIVYVLRIQGLRRRLIDVLTRNYLEGVETSRELRRGYSRLTPFERGFLEEVEVGLEEVEEAFRILGTTAAVETAGKRAPSRAVRRGLLERLGFRANIVLTGSAAVYEPPTLRTAAAQLWAAASGRLRRPRPPAPAPKPVALDEDYW